MMAVRRVFRVRMRRGRALLSGAAGGGTGQPGSTDEEVVVAEETAAFLVREQAAEVVEVIEPDTPARGTPAVEPDPDAAPRNSADGEKFIPPRRLPTRIPRGGKKPT